MGDKSPKSVNKKASQKAKGADKKKAAGKAPAKKK